MQVLYRHEKSIIFSFLCKLHLGGLGRMVRMSGQHFLQGLEIVL